MFMLPAVTNKHPALLSQVMYIDVSGVVQRRVSHLVYK